MLGLPKNYPGKHAVMLLIVAVLLLLAFMLDHIFDGFEPIDIVYGVPIIAAAFLLYPFEILATGLIAMIFELTSEMNPVHAGTDDIWTAVAIGLFAAMVALAARLVRRYIHRIATAGDSLESSPLAYAEVSFPGYALKRSNDAFRHFLPPDTPDRGSLFETLPAETGAALTSLLDKAVAAKAPVSAEEFPMPAADGQISFWNLSIIPEAGQRSAPESVSVFALDVTGSVHRGRIRDAALRISSAVMSSLNLDETLRVVIDSLAYIAGTNAGALFLIEDDQWIGACGWGAYTTEQARKMRLPLDEFPSGIAAVEGKQALAVQNVAADIRFSPARVREFSMKSALVVPLVTGNRQIGAAWLIETGAFKSFTDEQVEFATVIGAQAALAIDNAAAYENEHSMRKSLEAIEAVSEAGLTSLDLNVVLTQLVSSTRDVLSMDAAMIMLEDATGEFLEARATAGAHGAIESSLRLRVGEGLAGRAFLEGVPMKIDDIEGHEREMCPDKSCRDGSCPFSEKLGIRSVLAVPLRISGRVTGILQVGSMQANSFVASEWGLIQVLADRASMAVQNSLLHDATRKDLARVALLRDVAAACAGHVDMRDIAERALEAIDEQLGCEMASIFYFDPQEQTLVNIAATGHPPAATEAITTISMDEDTFLVRAIKEGDVATHLSYPAEDASEAERFILQSLGIEHNRRAYVPFIYKGEIVGGMALAFPGDRPFTDAGIDTLKGIANQLAVAIRNARLSGGGERMLAVSE